MLFVEVEPVDETRLEDLLRLVAVVDDAGPVFVLVLHAVVVERGRHAVGVEVAVVVVLVLVHALEDVESLLGQVAPDVLDGSLQREQTRASVAALKGELSLRSS